MATPQSESAPLVSVIVPARNEESSLGACLESLVAQEGIAFEIIVVDDSSTDRTRAIAESFPGVRVIEPGPLPEGWTGKNNAVTAGVREARGEWLLFTDADTVHKPGSLAKAMAEAQKQRADLLSYSPEQEVHSFWERAVMPVIFAELARKYPPSRMSDPATKLAAANGQYLLISRAAYDAVGGHAAVADSLLEDVALAKKFKVAGYKIIFRYGGDAVRTRMYRSFRQLREGWTKNLALLFPSAIALALWSLVEFAAVIACLIFAGMLTAGGDWKHATFYLIVPSLTVMRIATAHFPWTSNVLGILGLPIFSYLLLHSKLSHRMGSVIWKGRSYGGRDANARPLSHHGTVARR
jgi:glycosyltransferase involved in cell wall biosynthesis